MSNHDEVAAAANDAKAKAAAQSRKRDTRRKILFGYAFLDWLTTLPQPERKRLASALHLAQRGQRRKQLRLRLHEGSEGG